MTAASERAVELHADGSDTPTIATDTVATRDCGDTQTIATHDGDDTRQWGHMTVATHGSKPSAGRGTG